MSRVMRKPAFCICKNKGSDQLRDNHAADQHLRFCYIDSTIPLLSKSEISSLWSSSVTVQSGLCRPSQKSQRQVLSHHGSYGEMRQTARLKYSKPTFFDSYPFRDFNIMEIFTAIYFLRIFFSRNRTACENFLFTSYLIIQ